MTRAPRGNPNCVCGGFPTPASNSQMLAGCPGIPLSSVTFYPETGADSMGEGFKSHKTAVHFRHRLLPVLLTHQLQTGASHDPLQFQMPITSPGCCLYFWPTGYKPEGPTTRSLCSINLLEQLRELEKTCLLTGLQIYYKRILKDMNQQPDEEMNRTRSQTKKLLSPWSVGPSTAAGGPLHGKLLEKK